MSTKKSKAEEALQLLDDLDSFAAPTGDDDTSPNHPARTNPSGATSGTSPSASSSTNSNSKLTASARQGAAAEPEAAADVLAFLDEITQKSAEPTRVHISRSATPTLRKSTERVRLGGPGVAGGGAGGVGGAGSGLGGVVSASSSTSSLSRTLSSGPVDGGPTRVRISDGQTQAQPQAQAQAQAQAQGGAGGGGWGWGSVWSTASAALQQAKSAVDEQVKHLPRNEQARKWGEGVIEYAKTAQLDKLGQDFKRVGLSTLTDILNVVAPPISEHEVIQVWLSHDMQGYEGIESLSYRALARILEQVQGGDLVLNRGDEARPKDASSTSRARDLNAVQGYDQALKLAQVNIQDILAKNASKPLPERNDNLATTYSYVYLRIQPFFVGYATGQVSPSSSTAGGSGSGTPKDGKAGTTQEQLQFLIHLNDPAHKLVHSTVTQAVPAKWLALWDQYDWVEDLVAEALRVGVEVVGQEYVVARMGWGGTGAGEGKEKEGSTSVDPGEKGAEGDSS